MKARVMISSVVNDEIPLGKTASLEGWWYEAVSFAKRLSEANLAPTATTQIPFSFVRGEIFRHLQGKYGFDAYAFEFTPSAGRAPQDETISEALKSHLVIGIFGSKAGWKVPDQDPLTPTLREWRAALLTPLKFKVFWLRGSISPQKLPGELGSVMRAISDYKTGKIYWEFVDLVDLLNKIDAVVREHLNTATISYAKDVLVKEPTDETEQWLLSPYRSRQKKMLTALETVAGSLGTKKGVITLGDQQQRVSLHAVPDSFSIPESRKFAAYVFDDEVATRKSKESGRLHFIAVFGGITDLQIRRHLGNLEAAKMYSASWGFYASEPGSGTQCVYLPRCANSLRMQSAMARAIDWLTQHAKEVAALAELRARILDLL